VTPTKKLIIWAQPGGIWLTEQQRRNFFNELAGDLGMDPLVANNWYRLASKQVLEKKGGGSVLKHHSQSHPQALIDLYPEIGLEKEKFHKLAISAEPRDRRNFFDVFAYDTGFDPLVVSNWYSVSYNDVVLKKLGAGVLEHYNGSHIRALIDCYPELHLERDLFEGLINPSYWDPVNNRKNFFLNLANNMGFDPLVAGHWHSVSQQDVNEMQGGRGFLEYYGGSHIRALMDIYPEFNLEKSLFLQKTQNEWFV